MRGSENPVPISGNPSVGGLFAAQKAYKESKSLGGVGGCVAAMAAAVIVAVERPVTETGEGGVVVVATVVAIVVAAAGDGVDADVDVDVDAGAIVVDDDAEEEEDVVASTCPLG